VETFNKLTEGSGRMDIKIILKISILVLLINGVIELLSILSILTGEAPFSSSKSLEKTGSKQY
jgi:TRAP-type mannitol/chloroaromatic compound transport system permease small subunit